MFAPGPIGSHGRTSRATTHQCPARHHRHATTRCEVHAPIRPMRRPATFAPDLSRVRGRARSRPPRALLDRAEEAGGVGAVDDAVVVGQRQVHHRPDGDRLAEVGVVDHDRPLDDRAGAEDADLRLVDDRGVEQGAAAAGVGEREGAAAEFVGARSCSSRVRSARSAILRAIPARLRSPASWMTGTAGRARCRRRCRGARRRGR